MAARLAIAFLLSAIIAAGCYVLAPRYGVDLPPWLPLLAFIVMVAACFAYDWEQRRIKEQDDPHTPHASQDPFYPDPDATGPENNEQVPEDARPIRCAGPRPIGELSRKAAARRNR